MLFGEGPQIKNIAADLNKLFRQGSLLNQSGQTVEGDSTADQGTSDLLAARDPVIQEISVGMSGEQSARYTVSGTPPLSLPNSLGKPLKAWSVDVLPYQEGTGDPSPSNVRPIHGTDKLTITTAGKNLFDPVNYSAYLQEDGTYTARANQVQNILNYIPEACVGKRCTFSAYLDLTNSGNLTWERIAAIVNGVTIVSTQIINGNTGYEFVSFTPTSTSDTIRFDYGSNGANVFVFSQLMLEISDTRTSYTPYLAPSQTVLTLPQTVYTGTIGSEGGESRKGKIVLDGSESWTLSTYAGSFYAPLHTMKKWTSYSVNRIMCDKLLPCVNHTSQEYMQSTNAIAGYADYNNTYPTQNWIYAKANNCATASEFKAWLAENPVTLVYDLADPVQFPLSSPTIPTPTGTATTWATAEDGTVESMEVTYVGKA